jgi:hypothetical protein
MGINISDKYKCIFIHIPRVAGTSVKKALELEGRGHLPWQYYYLVYPEEWKSYMKFAVVRNPWDRMVSAYKYAKMQKSHWHDNINKISPHPDYDILHDKTFTQCCEILQSNRDSLRHEVWHPQYFWIMKNEDNHFIQMIDYVLRFENLNSEFIDFCKKLNIGLINLQQINPSQHSNYRQYYTQETRGIIENIYSRDIEVFNYCF